MAWTETGDLPDLSIADVDVYSCIPVRAVHFKEYPAYQRQHLRSGAEE